MYYDSGMLLMARLRPVLRSHGNWDPMVVTKHSFTSRN